MNFKSYFKYYISSLFLSFSLLSVVLLCAILSNPEITSPSPAPITENVYLPQKEDCFNLLLTISETKEDKPSSFFLLSFNPIMGQIPVASIPQNFLLNGETLSDYFKNNGAKNTVELLKDSLNIPLEKYICLNRESFEYIMALTDNVKVNLPQKVAFSNNFSVNSGEAVLNGSLAFDLIKKLSENSLNIQSLNTSAEIIAEVINKILPLFGKSAGERIFTHTVNNCFTNISYINYENFLKPCEFLTNLKKDPAFPLVISKSTDKNLKELFTF